MALGQTGGRDGVVRLSGLALKFPAVTVAIWVARLNGLSRAQAATPYLSRRGHGPGPVMWTALQDWSARPRRKGSQICVPRSRDPGQSLPPEKPSPSHSGAHGRPSSRGPVGQQPQRSALRGHRGAQNDHERERHERRCPPAFTMPPSALPPPSWRESPPRPRSGPSGRQSPSRPRVVGAIWSVGELVGQGEGLVRRARCSQPGQTRLSACLRSVRATRDCVA